MPFSNPVMAGAQIVRKVMQSANFVANVAGWAIFRNGNAQFNNVTLTGTFMGTGYALTSTGAFFYSGVPATGNLILSIAPPATTVDPHSNAVKGGGLAVYNGTQIIFLGPVSGTSELEFFSGATFEATPANVASGLVGSGATQAMELLTSGPQGSTAGGTDWVQVQMMSANKGASSAAIGWLNYIDTGGGVHGQAYWDSAGFHIANQCFIVPSDQRINTVADQAISGLSVAVLTGVTYRFRALIAVIPDQTGGTANISMHGPGVTGCGAGFSFTGAAGTAVNWGNALPSGGVAMTNGQVTWMFLEGIVAFSVAGTVTVQAHTSVAADTFLVKFGSFLEFGPAN